MDVVFNESVVHKDKQEKEKIEPEFVEFEEKSNRDVLRMIDLEEDIYMHQPQGYSVAGTENMVCKLKKSLDGFMS